MAKPVRPSASMSGVGTRTTPGSPRVTKSRTKAMPSEEQIRARAYEIYLARNNGPGDATSDWVQAERELLAQYKL